MAPDHKEEARKLQSFTQFSNSMTVTALVSLGGAVQASGALAAYVGTEMRGLQGTASAPPFGPYAGVFLFQITLYAEAGGDVLGFRFVLGGSTSVLAETLTFEVNGNVGSVVAPMVLTDEAAVSPAPPAPAQ